MFRKILIPIDTAEPAVAEPGVYFGAQLAALTNAAVRMVHILSVVPLNLQAFLPSHLSANRESSARSVLLDLAKKADVPMGLFSIRFEPAQYPKRCSEKPSSGVPISLLSDPTAHP